MILSKKEWLLALGIIVLFFALRIPGIHIPYHQDEYKWVQYSHPEIVPPGTVPHPPLTEFIYTKIGPLVGDNNFRAIPLAFSFVNLFVVFYLAKIIFDKKTAFWSSLLFALSYFSVLASLMVDVDGAVMPLFFLLSLVGYYRFKQSEWKDYKWLSLLALCVIGGFLTKVVFVLPIAAIALDYAIERGVFRDKRKLIKYAGLSILLAFALVLILVLSKYIFPFFNLSYSLKYWEHFAVFSGRGWMQTFIQFAKAIMYASPLLILPVLFVRKEIFNKARPLFFFVMMGSIFYLFVFDFSLGALDRYFQFLVVPLSIISSAVLARYIWSDSSVEQKVCLPDIIAVSVISFGIFAMQFFQQAVPPLHPKTEWLSRLASFKWNFLFPFTGGSGPIPFYVSFQFIALLWIVSIVFVVLALWNKDVVRRSIFAILMLGLVYNAVFAEEYLLGYINGSSSKLVNKSVEFIKSDPEIDKVIVYNDNGGWEIKSIGKYQRRMYATPQFEAEYRSILTSFSGHIMYVNAPRVDKDSFYQKYFDRCEIVFAEKDNYITGQVLDCTKK
jgi:4-amino-4-deoxy-L-arabinose transferase-like glycosyltransferase